MTLTKAERDWLAALWRQAERDAEAFRVAELFLQKPGKPWPTRPPLSW